METLTDAPVSGLAMAEDGSVTGVELERRDARVRPDDPDPAAAGAALPAARAPPGPAGALSRALARLRLPDHQGASARCCPTTRSTSSSRRRSPARSRRRRCSGTDHTDGLHLVYLPKYCDPDAPEQSEDDESVYRRFTDYLARLSPGFSRDEVVDWTVQRAKLVEPVHTLRPDGEPRVAPIWPGVEGLALASNAQIYPYLLNGDSVMGFAEGVAGEVAERLGLTGAAAKVREKD